MCSCEINLRDQLDLDLGVDGRMVLKCYLQEEGWGNMAWFDLPQYRDRWRALV